MAMVKCGECDKEFSSSQMKCPHCGKQTGRGALNVVLLAGILILIVGAALFMLNGGTIR